MSDRDRLVELLKEADDATETLTGNFPSHEEELQVFYSSIADYLLDNGVIILPCAMGDTVYMIQKRYTKCSKYQECRDEYNCQGCEELGCDSHIEHYISSLNSAPIDWIVTMENQFGKTVFLTKEEAEAKLEELKGE